MKCVRNVNLFEAKNKEGTMNNILLSFRLDLHSRVQ